MLFRPDRNEFNGRVSAQLQVRALRPAGEGAPEEEQFFPALLQEMSRRASKKPEYDFPEAELRPEHLLKEQMEKFRMTDAELREVYIRLRELRGRSFSSPEELAAAAGQPVERLFTALMAFSVCSVPPRRFR